jgi:long-chain fatty acid transport protein
MGRFVAVAVLALILTGQQVLAAGFAIYDWSARGVAMGGATMAGKPDASAVASNPAAMTGLNGTQVMTGLSAVAPMVTVSIDGQKSSDAESNVWMLPHAYAVTQLGDRYWLGIGVFNRFGLGTEFDENWPGAGSVYYAAIKSVSLTPVLGMLLTDNWSIGLGAEANYFDFTQKKKVGGAYDVKVQGDDVGVGVNLSTWYAPTDWLSMGLMYRSSIDVHPRGEADSNLPFLLGGNHLNGDADGEITLPDSWSMGLCITPSDRLSLEFDATRTGWSSYKELDIRINGVNPSGVAVKDWKDAWRLGIGAEYALTPSWDLRAGYVYDETPVRTERADYMVPANDRQLFSTGLGWHDASWSVDLGYTYLLILDRKGAEVYVNGGVDSADFEDGDAHLLSMSVAYRF